MAWLDLPPIASTMPCIAKPGAIRFTALTDKDISPVMPYLNATIDGAIYNHDGHTLTFRWGEKRISLFPGKITGAIIDDIPDAEATLARVVALVNDHWERRDGIEPSYERRQQLGALDIYKLLPRTNCRKCKLPTCLAFAALVTQQKTDIGKCRELLDTQYRENRSILGELLRGAGYDVPPHLF